MSISGMTGFARAEGASRAVRWVWEVKSVNGRGLDLKLRMPAGFDALDPPVRDAVGKRFKRGSLQANLALTRDAGADASLRIDTAYVEKLLEAGRPYIEAGVVAPPRWDGLLALRGVVIAEEAEADADAHAALEVELLRGFALALDELDAARRAEGRMLSATLGALADQLDSLIVAARASAAAAPEAALERIRQRLAALAPEVQLDPARVAQEAAIAASRADVQEELDRLAAHASELRALLSKPEPAGRRLDFLGQELTREANTLCSKAGELALTRLGLDLKAVVDQIKEQAANVE
ncbi:MAG TPA: YicC/YloC family endoribonuclease [Caulobacterales bacterium]|nr:YicC/YloC family endoribonuclease [Caulobacterales bacterium]